VQHHAAAGDGQAAGGGEQPQPQPFRLPPAGLVPGQGEHLQPRAQLAGQGDDGAADPVLRELAQRQVGQPGVLGAADAVLGAGPAAVPQFQVGELPAGSVGGERGDRKPSGIRRRRPALGPAGCARVSGPTPSQQVAACGTPPW